MLPSEGGKHIFTNLVSCRMEIQQNLKTVRKNLENTMTIDEEMKDLSAKAAEASRKQEKCENNTWFAIVFLNLALPRWRSKSEKRCQYAFNNAHEQAEHAIFRVQVGVCLSLELCFLPRRGAHFQKSEGLKLD